MGALCTLLSGLVLGNQPVALAEWLRRCGWSTRCDLCTGVTKLLHTTVKMFS